MSEQQMADCTAWVPAADQAAVETAVATLECWLPNANVHVRMDGSQGRLTVWPTDLNAPPGQRIHRLDQQVSTALDLDHLAALAEMLGEVVTHLRQPGQTRRLRRELAPNGEKQGGVGS